MDYMPKNLQDKWFRSKASSASRLSPDNLALSNVEGFMFLRGHYCDKSLRGESEGKRTRKVKLIV